MYPVSQKFLNAVRYPRTTVTTAQHRNIVTGAVTELPIKDGSVTVDAASKVRRTLALTLPGTAALWDVLDTPGGEITVTQGIQYVDHTIEMVPLGVFVVDQNQMGYSPGGELTMTCPDRWLRMQRNNFGLARASVPGNAVWQEIKRLVEGSWSAGNPFPGWAQLDTSATDKVGTLIWSDGNRENAVNALCAAYSLEAFYDASGLAVLRPVPNLSVNSSPVWTVDASPSGVLVDADRTRDLSSFYNAIIATTSASDIVFAPVEVKNTTSGDPYSVTGPLGYVPLEWSDPSFRSSAQARTASLTRLRRTIGVAKQLNLTTPGNCALDAEDVITALLPQIDRDTPRPAELHIVDSVTHPLRVDGTQTIATRSTRPTTDGS